MSERETEELKKLLKRSLPRAGEVELPHDLWPSMLQRLQKAPIRAPWWDWALLAAASALILFFPGMIPALLYHL
jgi:hypothetical protein